MFPLFSKELPSSASELERALNESLRRVFTGVSSPVSIRDKAYPQIASIEINLDRAQLRANAPRPPSMTGASKPAIVVDEMKISADDVSAGPAAANLRLQASGLEFNQGRDANGEIVLL